MTPEPPDRFDPNATDAMARMFDGVSPRYRLLNRILSMGQDTAWRKTMWEAVPADARVVLDLCTGDGSSLPGLRRPGRLVVGLDASFGMLEQAESDHGGGGWAPRLVCGDAFRLPIRDAAVDAVTIAFGIRNLRPQPDALAELARVMRPGATLIVLEATAPPTGTFAPLHRCYLTYVVPLLGRLSPDPTAYEYLGKSVLEFGAGTAFTAAAEQRGFTWRFTRPFLLGATRLWVARAPDNRWHGSEPDVQTARLGDSARGEMPTQTPAGATEQRIWDGVQAALSIALAVALAVALRMVFNPALDIPLRGPNRGLLIVLTAGGIAVFGTRGLWFLMRALRSRPRV